MTPISAVLLSLVGGAVCVVSAADAWVMRGYVDVELTGPRPCGVSAAGWRTTTLFHNLTDQPRLVRALDVSSGGVASGDVPLQPRESAALIAAAPGISETRLWVAHFDVPGGVVVEDRLQYLPALNGPCGAPRVPVHPPTWQLPVYASLSAPGNPQVHLGTDVQGGPMRVNVAIFNSSATPAAAHVELRSAFCAQVVATHDLQVGPTAVEQISIPVQPDEACTPAGDFIDPAAFFATVVVDQPSLSYVTVLSNTQEPSASVTVGIPH
jgi:hypothetical protein